MRSVLVVAFGFMSLAASLTAGDQQPTPQEQARAFAASVNRPLVYHVPAEAAVRVERDLVYRGSPSATADVYRPTNAQGRAPVVILIHGGVPAAPQNRRTGASIMAGAGYWPRPGS